MADESSETPNTYKPTDSDPTGVVSLFTEAGTPAVTDDLEKVFGYVDKKARSIGEHIRKNRGLPPGAKKRNMLSVEEKAVCILGRALGVTWPEIMARITETRLEAGEAPPDSDRHETLPRNILRSHRPIIAAIQADLLAAIEAYSPLVGGQQRFLWRARILEYYRRRILEIATDETLPQGMKDDAITQLDTKMRPHLAWFDKIGESADLSALLVSPADLADEQSRERAEDKIERMYEEGEIDDVERIEKLRSIRHGTDDVR